MSGRPKEKVHIYDLDCKYIRTFDCINDFRKHYWPEDIGKRPLFIKQELGHDYQVIEEAEIIALKTRPGREAIRLILAIENSEYCKKQDQEDNIPVQVFNLRGDLIAEFASQRLVSKMMAISPIRVSNHLNNSKRNKTRAQKVMPGGLIFRYKE